MTQRQLPATVQVDAGGPTDALFDMINGNSKERAAVRNAIAAGKQVEAQQRAEQMRQQRRLKRAVQSLGFFAFGFGLASLSLTIGGVLPPWWMSLPTLLAALLAFWAARRV